MARSGRVEYKGRAFQQDAMAAMQGDIVRALIELITNADDAYGTQSRGSINIRIGSSSDLPLDKSLCERYPLYVSVQDHAKGLDAHGMESCFAVLGGTNIDFQHAGMGRGLLGRGAKDVAAFGQARFEAIKNDRVSLFVLEENGDWRLSPTDAEADVDDYIRLGLMPGESGLTATVLVGSRFKRNVRSRRELVSELKDHAQLRHLLQRRQVVLDDERSKEPSVFLEPRPIRGELILDKQVALQGYKPIHLTIRKLPESVTAPLTAHSEHGILISGANASYENTLFSMEGRPEASVIAGEVNAPEIEELVRQFDAAGEDAAAGSTDNAIRLVARDREQLAREHPYFKALRDAVLKELLPVLDAMAAERAADRKPGDKLNKAFAAARIALARELQSIISEIDEEELEGPGSEGENVSDLAIIPPRLILHPGEERSLTVRLAGVEGRPYSATAVHDSGPEVVEVVSASQEFSPHPRLAAVNTTIRVKAGSAVGDARVVVRCGELVAEASITVMGKSDGSGNAIDVFEFERQQYVVAPERHRNLVVRGPITLLEQTVKISHTGVGALVTQDAVLKPAASGRHCEARVRFSALADAGTAFLEAVSESGSRANCRIDVREHAPAQGLDLEIRLDPASQRVWRASTEEIDGTIRVTIYAGHPALRKLLGTYSEAKAKYANEDDRTTRAVMAEIIALDLASFLVEREAERRPALQWDPARTLKTQRERNGKLLVVAQAALEDES